MYLPPTPFLVAHEPVNLIFMQNPSSLGLETQPMFKKPEGTLSYCFWETKFITSGIKSETS